MEEKPLIFFGFSTDISNEIKDVLEKKLLKELEKYMKEENEYIVHFYKSTNQIEIFERKDEGTRLVFGNDESEENKKVWDPSSYILPVLYGKDKKGKERMWKVWVVKNTMYKTYGETHGAKTPSFRSFKGMNIGKKNATSPEEQAKREAERDWVKQLDKDYHAKSKEGIEIEKKVLAAKKIQGGNNVNLDEIIRGRGDQNGTLDKTSDKEGKVDPEVGVSEDDILPMHCQLWSNAAKCLKYFDFDSGVYIQPKLDGVRCLVKIRNGKVFLISRSGKHIVWLNHIRDEVKLFLKGMENIQLDCEVYAEKIVGLATKNEKSKKYSYEKSPKGENELEMLQRFDVISGAARPKRNQPHPLEEQLCLYVFDVADPSKLLDQDKRFGILKKLFSSNVSKSGKTPHIKMVETKVIYYQEEIEDYHDDFAQREYEGVILRARDLYYESEKSLKMRKYKYFCDEEYPIVDIICDDGVGRENFRWVCEKIVHSDETNEGNLITFQVKPMGTREQRWEWYDNSDEYIGKLLNVRYQTLTYEGAPRFPRGTHIRDYD